MGLRGSWCKDELVMDYQCEVQGLLFLVNHMHRTHGNTPTPSNMELERIVTVKGSKSQPQAQDRKLVRTSWDKLRRTTLALGSRKPTNKIRNHFIIGAVEREATWADLVRTTLQSAQAVLCGLWLEASTDKLGP